MGGIFRAAHEFRGRESHRLGTAHDMVSQQKIVRGAQADRPCPEPEFDAVLFGFHEKYRSGFEQYLIVTTAT